MCIRNSVVLFHYFDALYLFFFIKPDTDILLCASTTALSGHYYAELKDRPTKTNPVSASLHLMPLSNFKMNSNT